MTLATGSLAVERFLGGLSLSGRSRAAASSAHASGGGAIPERLTSMELPGATEDMLASAARESGARVEAESGEPLGESGADEHESMELWAEAAGRGKGEPACGLGGCTFWFCALIAARLSAGTQ